MSRPVRRSLGFLDGLGFRLVMLLSVALLPLGLIATVQTLNLSEQAASGAEAALVSRTEAAAAGGRALMQSAIGSAEALSTMVQETLSDRARCNDNMQRFIETSGSYAVASFIDMDGMVICTSMPEGNRDLRGSPVYKAFLTDPRPRFVSLSKGGISGRSVIVLSLPIRRDGAPIGYISLSLPHDLLKIDVDWTGGARTARTLFLNDEGALLSSEATPINPLRVMPTAEHLPHVLASEREVSAGVTPDGERRVFTVVPMIPGMAYALGTWAPDETGLINRGNVVFAIAFPIAMWLVSLAVAYLAVYRLVIRHIRDLRGQMRRFALGNRDTAPPVLTEAPSEIQDVSQTFHNLARILIRDEEALEKSVGEKTVLLKEVHHRVKNNLQLIASIISMQARLLDDAGAKQVLRSVQDRVTSLATIYRNLYQAEHLASVEADRLIGDILNQMSNATVPPGSDLRVTTEIGPLSLIPDQAVPLSLLATEAFTNAVKYVGRPADGPPFVSVRLHAIDDQRVELVIENSIGETVADHEGTGLGSQLIEAFAMQLDAESEVGPAEDGTVWRMRIAFEVDHRTHLAPEDDRAAVLTSAPRQRR